MSIEDLVQQASMVVAAQILRSMDHGSCSGTSVYINNINLGWTSFRRSRAESKSQNRIDTHTGEMGAKIVAESAIGQSSLILVLPKDDGDFAYQLH